MDSLEISPTLTAKIDYIALWRSWNWCVDSREGPFEFPEMLWRLYPRRGQKEGKPEPLADLPTASADGNLLWAGCDKLDGFQTVRGRDADRLPPWRSEYYADSHVHVCSSHVHEVPAELLYVARNSSRPLFAGILLCPHGETRGLRDGRK